MGLIAAGLATLAGSYLAKKVGQAVSSVGSGVRDAAQGAQEVVKTFMPSTYNAAGSQEGSGTQVVVKHSYVGDNLGARIATLNKRRENNK